MTLQPEEIPAGGFARLDVRVPTERDDASTTKVEVQLPAGFLSVSTEPVPGWDAKIVKRKLDKPVEQFGEQVSEEGGQVSFTANGDAAGIGPGEFQDFGLSLSVPERHARRSRSRWCRHTATARWCAGSARPTPSSPPRR